MSESKPKVDPREVADRMRRTVYENHGPDAVKQAEKHIRRAVIELDQKRNK